MKGEITIDKAEVHEMVKKRIAEILHLDIKITDVHDYYGSLQVKFTDEPEEEEETE